jgi:hypothetical protein
MASGKIVGLKTISRQYSYQPRCFISWHKVATVDMAVFVIAPVCSLACEWGSPNWIVNKVGLKWAEVE